MTRISDSYQKLVNYFNDWKHARKEFVEESPKYKKAFTTYMRVSADHINNTKNRFANELKGKEKKESLLDTISNIFTAFLNSIGITI